MSHQNEEGVSLLGREPLSLMFAVLPTPHMFGMDFNGRFTERRDAALLAAFCDRMESDLDLLANQSRPLPSELEWNLAGTS
jgi:hypothetical protein